MYNSRLEILRLIAKSWNNLDASYLADILSDNIIYESQWALTPIYGKNNFLIHINKKFNAIKAAMLRQEMTIFAQIAYHPELPDHPILVLTQIFGTAQRQVSIVAKVHENRAERVDVCFVPDPSKAILTNEIPK